MTESLIPEYTIRECTTVEDFTGCLNLQRKVWQFSDLDITPLRTFVVTRHSGGASFGAFDRDNRLLGFCLMLPAIDVNRKPYFYSQMLAVEPGLQNSGIGVKLKLAQRDFALRIGMPMVTWTFDPLQSRNAHLNINKLGCVIRKYTVNYYGNVSTSALHAGLDTDRLFAQWWVGSQRVADALAGKRRADNPVAFVEIPREIDELKKQDLAVASRWQLQLRSEFQKLLSEGLYCAGFEASPNGNSRYLFFKDEHQEER
ncbi:MAG: GNAT family N-acetyltransferase [Acidobacteriota bacterium]